MALKGKIYSLAKQREDIDSRNVFESMIKRSADQNSIFMDGRNLAAGSIFADQIHANAITAEKIKADAVTTDKIEAGAITTVKIEADAVTADKIVAGAITTEHLAANSVTAEKISVDKLSAIQSDIGTITAGLIKSADDSSYFNMTQGKFSFANDKILYDGKDLSISADSIDLEGKVTFSSFNNSLQTTWSDSVKNSSDAKAKTDEWSWLDTTEIDGGAIRTQTITTDQIKAKSITSEEINVGELSSITSNVGTVNAGLIKSRDESIIINLDEGLITLGKPLKIQGKTVATEDDISSLGYGDIISKSGQKIFTGQAEDSAVHVDIDGESYQDGDPSPDTPIEVHSLNDFDVVSQKSEGGTIDGIEVGGRNLIIASNALRNTVSSSVGLSKWGYQLSNDKKSFSVNLDENEQYTLSFLGHNEGLTNQNVEVALNGATNEKKTIDVVNGSNKYNWTFTADNFKSSEEKIYPLQSLEDWSRYYKNSPAIVTNPNDIAYQKSGFSGVPLENMEQVRGGMFGSAFPINGNLNGGIDTPGTAWAGINISRIYLETNDATLLPKIRAIGDFFISHTMDIDIWGTPLKAFPNALTFDEVSRQWIPSTRFIHTRTFYHVAWALLEIYDATGDTKYSNLAGQLLDGATIPQLMTTGQANSNELPPYFSGAMFNTINNVGETSYEPDWVTFTNTNGDVVVKATNKWIELFGNSTRVSFDLYAWENKDYTVKSIADDYISHLLYLYNNQGLRKPDGHNLLYNFSHYEWEDEPHPDGYMIPVPMNWDFINEVFGQDQWFTGDLMFWSIIGFAEAGETQIATSLLDRYYELKAPDSEGRLLFYDRYTGQGTPLAHDTSKSITFTALYMQARNILGNHDYDAESLSCLEYYQKKSEINTVDGGFSWDTEEYNSFIENKSLGEILFSILENVAKSEPPVTVSFENFISNPIYILDIKLEKGNIATPWTSAPEDIAEDSNHPLIDKINLSLSEPLRSVGDVKDRLFRGSDGLWKVERNVGETILDGSEPWVRHPFTDSVKDVFEFTSTHKIKPLDNSGYFLSVSSSHLKGSKVPNPPINHMRVEQAGGATYSTITLPKSLVNESVENLKDWLMDNNITIQYEKAPIIETLDQDLQDKLNTLKSFRGYNYIYTVNNTEDLPDQIKENLMPTLHATFKGSGWLPKYNAEQARIDLKSETNDIRNNMNNLVTSDQYKFDKEGTNEILSDYQAAIDAARRELNGLVNEDGELILGEDDEPLQKGVVNEVMDLLDRTALIENDYGEDSKKLKFMQTDVVMGAEGFFIGDTETRTGIMISPRVEETTEHEARASRIDFLDNDKVVAYISSYMMEISRGIFVESAQIGEHKIETIGDGHTTFQWIPK